MTLLFRLGKPKTLRELLAIMALIKLIIFHDLKKHRLAWDKFFNPALPSHEGNPDRAEIECPRIELPIPNKARGKRTCVSTSGLVKQRWSERIKH